METKLSLEPAFGCLAQILSNDPRVAALPGTPAPVICKYCKAERYTVGINLISRIMWRPTGANPCTCKKGQAEYKRKVDVREAQEKSEKQAEEDKRMRDRVQQIISESGMGERFLQRTFDTFVTDTPDRKKIAAAAKKYAVDFKKNLPQHGKPLPGRNGLLLSGTIGTGKTHITASIANYLLNSGTEVICMTERNLFGNIRKTYAKNRENGVSESEVRGVYENVPLLIIDDLGKEKPSEWTLATLYAIIDGRYDSAMPVIITTNYVTQSLVQRLTPAGEAETTAAAIVDRLTEMCESIVITGDSWRSR